MQPQQPMAPQPDYSFITAPQQPAPRRGPSLGGGSMLQRILFVGVGLIVLLIVFVVIKGLVSGGGNGPALQQVAAEQQALIHLTSPDSQPDNISTANLYFRVTGNLVLTSQQSDLLDYLKQIKVKLADKQLNSKVSATVDAQLESAKTSNTYDSTYQQVMKAQLATYQIALKSAYNQTTGPNGRALLQKDYDSADLLLKQLSAN